MLEKKDKNKFRIVIPIIVTVILFFAYIQNQIIMFTLIDTHESHNILDLIYINITTNIKFILAVSLGLFYSFEFIFNNITKSIYEYSIHTKNTADNLLDNHCFFGLSNTLVLLVGSLLIVSDDSAFQVFFLISIILIIFKIFLSLIDVFTAYNNKVENSYANAYISHIFCYVDCSKACENDNINNDQQKNIKPIKALVFSVKSFLSLLVILLISVILTDMDIKEVLQNITIIFAALGFIFKEQINSLFLSAKLFFRDGFHMGDWIEVPELGVDGEIYDITAVSVVVKNWDKTETNIPFENFVNKSYKNWNTLKDENIRRIKRSLVIQQESVRPLNENDELFKKLKEYPLLKKYIEDKNDEIKLYNDANPGNKIIRQMTNIGTFREYIYRYLDSLRGTEDKKFSKIHAKESSTIIVRQLSPTEIGIPIEIYAFANTADWKKYEDIQSDIFDHLLVILKEFDLEIAKSL